MPDMRLPIGYALAWPDRSAVASGRIDWSQLARLDFEPPDTTRFPCLALAYDAARTGGTAPAWLSAANEVAVEAFLAGRISWVRIADVVAEVLDAHDGASADSVGDVYNADAQARRIATDVVDGSVGAGSSGRAS
jgi:1-deoxy-D-xylulose-5-phosphate reductoisomerase